MFKIQSKLTLSGDQQVNVELVNGLNVIEVQLNKGRRANGIMPRFISMIQQGKL